MNKISLLLIIFMCGATFSCDQKPDNNFLLSSSHDNQVIRFRAGVDPDASYDRSIDTHIDQNDPAANNGADTDLRIGKTASQNFCRALIKFNIAGYIPPYANVTRAVLSLYISNTEAPFNFNVHSVATSWTESANWNHSGYSSWTGGTFDADEIIGSASARDMANSIYLSIDLDPKIVQGWMSDINDNHGIILVPAADTYDDAYILFGSSENSTDYLRPSLTIEYKL